MALYHANEPVMVAKLLSFVHQYAGAGLGITDLARDRLGGPVPTPILGISPDAISFVVNTTFVDGPSFDGLLSSGQRKELAECCTECYNNFYHSKIRPVRS